jgi:hypothetical protein
MLAYFSCYRTGKEEKENEKKRGKEMERYKGKLYSLSSPTSIPT